MAPRAPLRPVAPFSSPPRPPVSSLALWALRMIVIALMSLLVARLVQLQVVEGAKFRQMAETNALRKEVISPARGLIYDRYGQPLALNQPYYQVAIVPGDLPPGREQEVVSTVSRLAGIPQEVILARLREVEGRQNPFVPVVVAEGLAREAALALRELQHDLPGVQVTVSSLRYYPLGEVMAHILGHVAPIYPEELAQLEGQGYHLHDLLGKAGVELVYENVLRGQAGQRLIQVDAFGHFKDLVAAVDPVPGSSIVLTIDATLQVQVARALKSSSKGVAAAAVMDVERGELLALVSLPSFDPNSLVLPAGAQEADRLLRDPHKPLLNHLLGEVFAPGSIFKPLVAAAALQEGIIRPATTYVSHGYIAISHPYDPRVVQVLRDWGHLGRLDLPRALAMASHVYFYYVAGGDSEDGLGGLGAERLARYAKAFGLGSLTGIDLPGEATGLVPDPTWKEKALKDTWKAIDTYSLGAGNGYLRITPLQMLVATAAIANGGTILKPHVLLRVIDMQGEIVRQEGREVLGKVPISPENLRIVREAMALAVKEGVAKEAQVPGLEVAGLATVDGPGEVGHGWFVGFAPAHDPKVAVVVFLQEGTGRQAAQVASQILEAWKAGQ